MNTTELKALAEKATPGPWSCSGFGVRAKELGYACVADTECDNESMAENAYYIAAANPAAILSLIADLESAQDELRALLATEQNLRKRVKELEEGLTNLMREFPTDFDMKEAGWDGADIERACSAHDAARALLEKTT